MESHPPPPVRFLQNLGDTVFMTSVQRVVIPVEEDEEERRRRRRKRNVLTMEEKSSKLQTVVINIEEYDLSSCLIKSILEKGTNKLNPISVEDCLEDRDLHLALMASVLPPPNPNNNNNVIDLSQENGGEDDEEISFLGFKPPISCLGSKGGRRRSKPFSADSVTEKGESSNSKNDPEFLCDICVEPKTVKEWFSIKACGHSYCTDCMARYVASKLQDNFAKIGCPLPDCEGCLEAEHCRSILPVEVFDRWGDALCEAMILGSEKYYCPFKDCSMMLIDDGKEAVLESECPYCCRLFCARCKAPWHTGIDCTEFQKLNKDEREREDIMLMKLAQDKLWRRCPNCKIYVEKTDGCLFMTCRSAILFYKMYQPHIVSVIIWKQTHGFGINFILCHYISTI